MGCLWISEAVLERLLEATRRLACSHPEASLNHVIADSAPTICEASGAALFLVEGDSIVLIAASSYRVTLPLGMRIPPGEIQSSANDHHHEVKRGDAEAVVCVRDEGIGIASDMLPRLFEPFAQAEAARQRAASVACQSRSLYDWKGSMKAEMKGRAA
jgi:hypothetical protein